MIDDSRVDPLTDEELEEEVSACLARGLEPCAGVECERWLDPTIGQVVLRTAAGCSYCGDCALLRDDFESVSGVVEVLFSRGVVIGRRFSVGPYTPAVRRDGDPEWVVLGMRGAATYLAHDAFEAVRWFCRLESGNWGHDPEAPPIVHPTDHVLAELAFMSHHGLHTRRSP